MAIVYGDSTSFPYEENFIDLSRNLIDCCVSLFTAQNIIVTSAASIRARELSKKTETEKLTELLDAMKTAAKTATGERARKIAPQVFDAARGVIAREIAELEAKATHESNASRALAEEARRASFPSIETFLLKNNLPKTNSELRLAGSEKGYTAKSWVVTPFGVEALFSVIIPPQSDWNKPRRVGEVSPGVDVQLPQSAGWLSKRIELQTVRLDKLFITELSISEEKTTISLRKNLALGGGYLLEVILGGSPKTTIATLGDDGLPTETARTLSGEEYAHVLRLWTKLIPSTQSINRRQAMLSATFNKKPLQENDMPEAVGLRLIQLLTPTFKEIAKRSLAPGELILRRDLGEGRREELYATKAELYERIKSLPESYQQNFDSLELSPTKKTAFSGSGLLRMEENIKQQPQGPVPLSQLEMAHVEEVIRSEKSPTPSPLPSPLPSSLPSSSPSSANQAAQTPPQMPPPLPRNTPSSSPSSANQAATATKIQSLPPSGKSPVVTPPNKVASPSSSRLPVASPSGGAPSAEPTSITALPLPASLQNSSTIVPPAKPAPSYITQEIPIQPFDDDEVSEFFDDEFTKAK